MLNSIKTSFKDSVIYGIGNIAVKVIGFLLIPLYTDPKYFSVDDFGIIALLDISGLVLIALMASGLPQSLMRWYWDKDFEDKQKGIVFMTIGNQLLVSLSFCILLLPFTDQFSELIFGNRAWSTALRLLILSTALQSLNNIINTLMRIQSRSFLFSVTNLIKLGIVLLLTIYLIVFKGSGVNGIYIAQIAGNMFFILLLSGYTVRNCYPFFNLTIFKSMSRYGFPLLLSNVAAAAVSVIDRYSLNSLALLKYVAIYSLAFKISSVLKLVIVDSIKMAITPMVMQKMNTPDNKRFYSKTLLYSSYVLMIGIITLSLFSYEIIKVISRSNEFISAYVVVPLLCLSVFFTNMRETSSYGLIINRKTRIVGINVVASSIINIILNILLIPKWNITGAAFATILTQLFYWFLNFYFSQKEYFIPYELKKTALLFACGSVLSFAGFFVNEMNPVLRIVIKTGCILSFPFILHLFKFYEHIELQALKGLFVKWSKLRNLNENIRSLKEFTSKD